MSSRFNTFHNVRVRLHRKAHDQWIAGWVKHLARDAARVHLPSYLAFDIGERVEGECYGDGTIARFEGQVIAQAGQDLAIQTIGSLTYRPSDESVRFEAAGLTGTLQDPQGRSQELMILDVSPVGLGGLVSRGVTPGASMSLKIAFEGTEISAQVQVANCHANDAERSHFRAGFHIVSMPRLYMARWTRLVSERAAL